MIVSIRTTYLSAGTGRSILAKHAIVCYEAIALMTKGKVKDA